MDRPPEPPAPDERNVLEPGCSRCPALVESRTRIAWGNGPLDAEILVVGEAPGAGTPGASDWQGGNHTGLAYTSRHSGRRIRRLFVDLGFADRVYYANAVRCFPADGDGSNREPTAEELSNCRGHLERELRQVDPAVVVPTGAHATRSLLAFDGVSLDGFLDRVLTPTRVAALDLPMLPLLHPSYQDVWRARLGYAPDAYREEIAVRLAELGVEP